MLIGVRISIDKEMQELDLSMHDEEGYNLMPGRSRDQGLDRP